MKLKIFLAVLAFLVIGIFSSNLGFAQAVLVEEGGRVINNSRADEDGWVKKNKALAQGKSIREIYSYQEFQDAYEMKQKRRVGVGLVAAGQMGLAGAIVDLNFTADNSFVVSFGGGPLYNSFSFQGKHSFYGKSINPYLAFGLAHWSSKSGNKKEIERTNPSFLGSKYLSKEEKASGEFAKTFLIPSVGLQYNQLFGRSVGTSLFAEVLLFMHPEDLTPVPTGSIGSIYYF